MKRFIRFKRINGYNKDIIQFLTDNTNDIIIHKKISGCVNDIEETLNISLIGLGKKNYYTRYMIMYKETDDIIHAMLFRNISRREFINW